MLKNNKINFYLIIFIVAMCSMLYEFILAETLAVIFGNTILRYNITIGFYIASMGLGSLLHGAILKKLDESNKFLYTELLLAILGSLTPMIILILDWFNRNYLHQDSLIFILIHFFICLVGIITGFEIPIILELVKKEYGNLLSKLLFFDYFGSFLGCLIFPLFLVNNLHLFNIGFLTSTINCFMGLISIKVLNSKSYKFAFSFILLIVINLLLYYSNFAEYIGKVFFE